MREPEIVAWAVTFRATHHGLAGVCRPIGKKNSARIARLQTAIALEPRASADCPDHLDPGLRAIGPTKLSSRDYAWTIAEYMPIDSGS
jgi:hypothetical protein